MQTETPSASAQQPVRARWAVAGVAVSLIVAGLAAWRLNVLKGPVEPVRNRNIAAARKHEERRDETNLAQAIAQYEQVIALQPDSVAAYAGIARSWLERGIWGAIEFRSSEAPARNAALKALELDPTALTRMPSSVTYLHFTTQIGKKPKKNTAVRSNWTRTTYSRTDTTQQRSKH